MLPGGEGAEYKDAQEGQKRRYVGCSKKGVTGGALSDHVVSSTTSVLNTRYMPSPVQQMLRDQR